MLFVKYWDVTSKIPLLELQCHKDYVRCDDFSPVSNEMCVTRSYDHTVKLWDVRMIGSKSVMELTK